MVRSTPGGSMCRRERPARRRPLPGQFRGPRPQRLLRPNLALTLLRHHPQLPCRVRARIRCSGIGEATCSAAYRTARLDREPAATGSGRDVEREWSLRKRERGDAHPTPALGPRSRGFRPGARLAAARRFDRCCPNRDQEPQVGRQRDTGGWITAWYPNGNGKGRGNGKGNRPRRRLATSLLPCEQSLRRR